MLHLGKASTRVQQSVEDEIEGLFLISFLHNKVLKVNIEMEAEENPGS